MSSKKAGREINVR